MNLKKIRKVFTSKCVVTGPTTANRVGCLLQVEFRNSVRVISEDVTVPYEM